MRAIVTTLGLIAGGAFAAAAMTMADRAPANAGITVVPGAAPVVSRAASVPAYAAQSEATPARRMAAASTWWRPAISDTWQWQLSGRINTGYDVAVYDIDLFDAPDAVLTRLRADGRRIVCYFSAGSSENWRADFKEFQPADMGKPLDGWAGERWIDTRSQNVRRIMAARLDRAAARGCDGVEPDNVDGYANANGLGLTAADQLDYNRFLATEAHRRGLAVGLKNDLDQVSALVDSFDFAVNEQCNQYRECGKLAPFTAASKPVFNAEYRATYRRDAQARAALCRASQVAKIRTLVLPLKLNDKFRFACD